MSVFYENRKVLTFCLLFVFNFEAFTSEIEVRSSVNLETIFTLISITSRGFMYQRGFDHDVKQDMLIKFSHFRTMQAARTTQRLLKSGFWLSSLALFSQCFSDLPEGRRRVNYPDLMLQEVSSIIGKGKNPAVFLDNYFDQIRDFFKISGFSSFFRNYRKYYIRNTKKVFDMVNSFNITRELKSFFGQEPEKYVVIISAVIPVNFNFGGSLESNGQKQFLCFKGLDNNPGLIDRYTFTNKINLENVIFHEFTHSFIKPVIRKNVEITMDYSSLFNYIKTNMRRFFYSNWTSALEEHMVRSYEILYYQKTGRKQFAKNLMKSYENVGFRLIKFVHDSIEKYQKNRLTFSENYKEILQSLDNIKPVKIRFLDRFGFLYRFSRERLIITRITEGSLFHRNGIKTGDIICAINGKNVYDYIHLGELFENLNREDDGKKVRFTFTRDNQLFDLELEIPFRYEWYFAPA